MLFPTDTMWSNWRIYDEMQKFFVLKWEELFSETTFESWQVRTSNIKSILIEIIESSKIASYVNSHHTNIKYLLKEMQNIISDDIVIKEFFPHTMKFITILEKEYKSESQRNFMDFSKLEKLSSILLASLNGYFDKLFESIFRLINDKPDKYKKKLSQYLILLAIEIKNIGFSDEYIHGSIDIFCNENDQSFIERFNNFRRYFNLEWKKYTCYFLLHKKIHLEDFSYNNLKIHKIKVDFGEYTESFYSQYEDGIVVEIEQESLDKYKAVAKSEKELKSILSLRRLYEPISQELIIHSKVIIKNVKDVEIFKTKKTIPKYIIDSNNPNKNFVDLVTLLDKVTEYDRKYIKASLQYYKLSLLANEDEAKIVNLWIALESLFQENGGNIIHKISKYVPAIMSRNYIKSILRNLSKDIKHLWKINKLESINRLLQKSSKFYIHPYDLLGILTMKSEDPLYKDFLDYLSVNSLLINRFHNYKNGIFKSGRDMRIRIIRHKNNIEWQLRRIYRLRNNIMHKGMVDIEVNVYYHHLYTYYINTIHEIIHGLKENKSWSLNYVFENSLVNFDLVLDDLEKNNNINLNKVYSFSIAENTGKIIWDDKV